MIYIVFARPLHDITPFCLQAVRGDIQGMGGNQQAVPAGANFGVHQHPQQAAVQQMPGQMNVAPTAAAPAASPAALAMSAGMSPAALSPQVDFFFCTH